MNMMVCWRSRGLGDCGNSCNAADMVKVAAKLKMHLPPILKIRFWGNFIQ